MQLLEFIPLISLDADRSEENALLELVRSRDKYGYITRTRNLLSWAGGPGETTGGHRAGLG